MLPLTLIEVKNPVTSQSLYFYGYERLLANVEKGRLAHVKFVAFDREFNSYWGLLFKIWSILYTPFLIADLTEEGEKEKLPVDFLLWVTSLIANRQDERLNEKTVQELLKEVKTITVILTEEEVDWKRID